MTPQDLGLEAEMKKLDVIIKRWNAEGTPQNGFWDFNEAAILANKIEGMAYSKLNDSWDIVATLPLTIPCVPGVAAVISRMALVLRNKGVAIG
jgi:hypothetical protein